jgi:hydrogenase expression/formation protein HypC
MQFDESAWNPTGGCHMCLAIPGKIIEISDRGDRSALVEVVGVRRHVDLGLLEDDKPKPGDWVLIHVGYAMSKISERDAAEQMKTLEMLGECEAAIEEVRGYGLEDAEAKTGT